MINLKEKLKNNELTIGSWLSFGNPYSTEIMARAGFDWLTIDMEHAPLAISSVALMIQVISNNNCVPLVRVPVNDFTVIKQVMDAGAHGVIVPMVNTAEEAEKAVAAVKYPPQGIRGVGLARAQKYGIGFDEYKKWNEENSIVIVQIEHIDAVNNLESILTVEGVDGFIIGPYDLSGSLGHPGEFDYPPMADALRRVADVSKKLGVTMGYHSVPTDAKLAKEKIAEGYHFLAVGTDFLYLGDNCRSIIQDLNISPKSDTI